MNILSAFSRDRIRAHQDAVAPLAHPIGEARVMHPGREYRNYGPLVRDEVGKMIHTIEGIRDGLVEQPDGDITVYLDDLRTCRPDLDDLRPGELEVAQMVETVAQHGFEGTTGLKWADATFRVRYRARAGVRAGLVAAGLVR